MSAVTNYDSNHYKLPERGILAVLPKLQNLLDVSRRKTSGLQERDELASQLEFQCMSIPIPHSFGWNESRSRFRRLLTLEATQSPSG